jgi:hypothetical protein
MRGFLTRVLVYFAIAAFVAFLAFMHRDAAALTASWGFFKTRVGIAALACLVAFFLALVLNADRGAQYFTLRRALVALNVLVMCALAAGIVIFANVIAARHYAVKDVTFKRYYSLSERTESILRKLSRKVVVHVLAPPQDPDLTPVRGLLDAYRAEAPEYFEISYENPGKDGKKVEATLQRLGIDPRKLPSPERPEYLIFEGENPDARVPLTKVLTLDELYEKDYSMSPYQPRIKGFKGEENFTKAVIEVTRERKTKIYTLGGHRETDPFGREESIRTLDAALRNLGYEMETLKLDFAPDSKTAEVPQDCDVLAIVGPRARFDDREIGALRAYIERGGRLLLMAEPVLFLRPGSSSVYFEDTRLNLLLKDYGLAIEEAKIHDPATGERDFVFAAKFDGVSSAHPITRPLLGLGILFADAAPITLLPRGEDAKAKAQSILETLPSAVAVKDIDAVNRGRAPESVAWKKGPFVLAAVVTKEVTARNEKKEARLVVTGDSSIATDALTEVIKGQLDFVLNAIAWLAEREETIAIDSRPPEILRLQVTRDELSWLKFMSLVEIPLACAVIAFSVWFFRRR